MSPNEYNRRILLAVTGMSPQIVTETLYSLAVERNPPFIPTEVHVITTKAAADNVRLLLLDRSTDHFGRLLDDYGISRETVRFDEACIHVVPGVDGEGLPDIRSPEHNRSAARFICDTVQEFTEDDESAIHFSIAGGRKTMGFYLGYAASLFGRFQDRMSHVLVSEPFEQLPGFFYPPKSPVVMQTAGRTPVRTDQARIDLANIPFVRMRYALDPKAWDQIDDFDSAIEQVQLKLAPPQLVIDLSSWKLSCAGREIDLSPVPFAFYSWLALRHITGKPGVSQPGSSGTEQDRNLADTTEFIHWMESIPFDLNGGNDLATRESLSNGIHASWLQTQANSAKAALTAVLGNAASQYLLTTLRADGHDYKVYGLHMLMKSAISIVGLPDEFRQKNN